MINGETVFLYVNDLGQKIGKAKLLQLFRNSQELTVSEPPRSFPEEISPYNTPIVIGLKKRDIQFKGKIYPAKIEAALYDIGALSIRIRVNFDSLEALQTFAFDDTFEKQIYSIYKNTLSSIIAKLNELKINVSEDIEQYRVYIINQKTNEIDKNFIAGILLQEKNYSSLSKDYVNATLSRKLSYYKDESIFVDWDGTVVIRENKECEHEILVAEIANVQLLELRIYSEKTINFVELMRKEINTLKKLGPFNFFSVNRKVYEMTSKIGEYRQETQIMLNEIDNIIAGFGDWYLAKLYSLFSDSFRLRDWKKNITENIEALDFLRSILEARITNQFSIATDLAIILLFIFEVILEIILTFKI